MERVRRIKNGESYRNVYGEKEWMNSRLDDDRSLLADAYLAEHCDTPIDEAWLRSIGFVRYTDESEAVYLPQDGRNPVVGRTHHGAWVINGTFIGTTITTRGQLLRLLSALGIPLPPNDAGAK